MARSGWVPRRGTGCPAGTGGGGRPGAGIAAGRHAATRFRCH